MAEYLVVFEYTDAAGPYAGNRFITPFADKVDVDSTCTEAWLQERDLKVVRSGIDQETATKLCDEVGFGPKLSATASEYGDDPELVAIVLAAQLRL